MSMLARYRKKGGFEQLLTLIETCGPSKREQLIKIIQAEDPGWAAILKTKSLTLEKLLSWSPENIGEVINDMPPKILASAFKNLNQDDFMKATATMAHLRRRELERHIEDSTPTPGEIETARMKILARVRELERDKILDLNRIDPSVSLAGMKAA